VRIQEAQVLWQAVQQLQMSDQEVIHLRYFLELSVGWLVDGAAGARSAARMASDRRLLMASRPSGPKGRICWSTTGEQPLIMIFAA